jgi:methionine-rich copper-binding protein CopC
VTVAPAPKSPATALIGVTLEPGRYSIDWRTMAEDGHPAKGTLTFVVR